MNDETIKTIYNILIMLAGAVIGLVLSFPIKWCWNYAVVYVFNLPVIEWGHAWCLWFLSSIFIKSYLYEIKR